ncbi:unnamed protein product [Choristocarpus tenellus]
MFCAPWLRRRNIYWGWTDNSTWTRGQAWAVYGYAIMFRLTGKEKYFKRSMELNRYFMENLPTDNVAYADFDAPIIDQCRDSSATAIAASALLDLFQLVGKYNPRNNIFCKIHSSTLKRFVVHIKLKEAHRVKVS